MHRRFFTDHPIFVLHMMWKNSESPQLFFEKYGPGLKSIKIENESFQIKRVHWKRWFSIKNILCMSVQHFHIAESNYNALAVSSFKIKCSIFPTNNMPNSIWWEFLRWSFILYAIQTGFILRKKAVTTRFFHFIWRGE